MASFVDCSDYAQNPYPEYCINTFLTSLDDRTNIAQNWRELEKYYHSLNSRRDEESEAIKRNIEYIASKVVEFYRNPKAKRPRGFDFEHPMIDIRRNEIPLRKQHSAQSLPLPPPPAAAELKRRVQAPPPPPPPAAAELKRRVQAPPPPPASSSKKRKFSIDNPETISSMSATPVLHYGEVTPKDPIGRFNHRAKKIIKIISSLNGYGGKSNKRRRGRKTRTRKYKKR
jgi:hypothetical protein